MTTQELITHLTNTLAYDKDPVSSSTMTNAEAVVWLNRAQDEICRKLGFVRTDVVLTLSASASSIDLSSSSFTRRPIEVHRIFKSGQELRRATTFPVTARTSDPQLWWVEGATLRFDGYYSESTNLTIAGIFKEVKFSSSSLSAECTAPEDLQPHIAEYAAVISTRANATENSQLVTLNRLEQAMEKAVLQFKEAAKVHSYQTPLISHSRYAR